jgi:hypothetical protein
MDYQDAIERACKHAHENSDEQARHGEYGSTYLKYVATAKFFEIAEKEGVDIEDRSIGSISLDVIKGVSAIQDATQ